MVRDRTIKTSLKKDMKGGKPKLSAQLNNQNKVRVGARV
jgi:hypothetical protein